ncbi:MAG: hypothetical protein PVG66_08350 [Chromatiales bacterium]|jgi:hypothetical protein
MALHKRSTALSLLILGLTANAFAEDEIIIIESDDAPTEEILIVDDQKQSPNDEIVIEPAADEISIDTGTEAGQSASAIPTQPRKADNIDIGIDEIWIEHSSLTDRSESVDGLNYVHLGFSAKWNPQDMPWEVQLAGRIDGYQQTGNPDWTDLELDYDESFVRYRSTNSRLTVGAQKVIWGRIDEIPPTDRLSTQDINRFILDDLADRRRARPMIRYEAFSGANKYDLFFLPVFREAELPDTDSIWYPIDRSRGKILGIETTPAYAAAMASSTIVENAPDSDGGVGLRFSRTQGDLDYAVTIQHGRQTVPYFSYDPIGNSFTALYPRSTAVGFDLGFESSGITWRFESAFIDEVTVTRNNFSHTEVEGFNWAAGMEFFPGDGDSRVNLQLAGNHLLNTPNILEREDIYNFNGSVEIPFARERWRANIRFFVGLDKQDIYLNPEIAFLAWEPHEIYLETHYFDGSEGTLGGFHQDHSLITLGWRAKF